MQVNSSNLLKELDTQKTKQLRSQAQVAKLREGQAGQELGVFSSSLNEPKVLEKISQHQLICSIL